uniref:Uncharacterized protein n=1 Tax=Meloidogyne enterolobii TaxID=390850 RepID=A0A6V7VUW0_MELEN|nr:unnamed protein product [Meloidogyne enterolobii]
MDDPKIAARAFSRFSSEERIKARKWGAIMLQQMGEYLKIHYIFSSICYFLI